MESLHWSSILSPSFLVTNSQTPDLELMDPSLELRHRSSFIELEKLVVGVDIHNLPESLSHVSLPTPVPDRAVL